MPYNEVGFDSYNYGATVYGDTFSLSHTIASDKSRQMALLFLNGGPSDRVPSSVQLGSTAATLLYGWSNGIGYARCFYIKDPPTGTNNWTRTDSGATWDILFYECFSVYDADMVINPFYRDYDVYELYAWQPTAQITVDTKAGDRVIYTGKGYNQNGTIYGTSTNLYEATGVVGTWYCHYTGGHVLADGTSETIQITGGWGTDHAKECQGVVVCKVPPSSKLVAHSGF